MEWTGWSNKDGDYDGEIVEYHAEFKCHGKAVRGKELKNTKF